MESTFEEAGAKLPKTFQGSSKILDFLPKSHQNRLKIEGSRRLGPLGASWGALRASRGRLGVILGHLWERLGASWKCLGGALERLGGLLGCLVGVSGASPRHP